jgi:hypothetical protein
LNLSSNFKQTTELPFQAIKETGAVEIPRRLKSGADVLQGEIHGEALLLPAQQLSGNADPVEHHLYPEKSVNEAAGGHNQVHRMEKRAKCLVVRIHSSMAMMPAHDFSQHSSSRIRPHPLLGQGSSALVLVSQ